MHVAFERLRCKSQIFSDLADDADFGIFSGLKFFGKRLG